MAEQNVLISPPAIAKSNPTKASPKAATHTAVIIARMLARSLQASANADTRIAPRATTAIWRMQDRHIVPPVRLSCGPSVRNSHAVRLRIPSWCTGLSFSAGPPWASRNRLRAYSGSRPSSSQMFLVEKEVASRVIQLRICLTALSCFDKFFRMDLRKHPLLSHRGGSRSCACV
jgi:hypothetical protein